MSIQTYVNRLSRLDQLIRLRCTGTPQELADKLGLSKRMVYEYLNAMRDLGAPIAYSNIEKSYFYVGLGQFFIGYKIKNASAV
ncbi:HTH domain-containing protein [Roseivirga sp. BDSF3-8]|uniref:HTH domain-containing protein n=1 Tax=Roseivirga sp. BDSF3-8 TaxID=3241598 RepID=UPI003532155C